MAIVLRSLLLFVATITSLSAAAAPSKEVVDGYAKMCEEAVSMPKPFGESDLKGNASLHKYCQCLAIPYAERALKAAAEMQNGKKPKKLLDEMNAETDLYRNTCRKKFGLPTVKAVQ